MNFPRLEKYTENEYRRKEDVLHVALYCASKNNNYFPFLLRFCRNIVFVETIILLGFRSFMFTWDDDVGTIISIEQICERMPLFSSVLFLLSIGELICLLIAFSSYMLSERKYLYRPNWKFTLILILHHLNTVPIFVSFPLIFRSGTSTRTMICCEIFNLISLFVNYFVQYSLYWMTHGIARKPQVVPEYYRYSFLLYYCCVAGFSISYAVFCMVHHLSSQIICIVLCVIFSIMLYAYGKSKIVSFRSKNHTFSLCSVFVFAVQMIINTVSLFYNHKGKLNIAILAATIPIAYSVEVWLTRRKFYRDNQNMKEILKKEDFQEYFSHSKAEDIGKAVQMNLRYIKDYRFITRAIDYYKPSFALYEAEFIIAEKKNDQERMKLAYNQMKTLNKITSLERTRLFSYRMNILSFYGDDNDPVINDCRLYLLKYAIGVSKFWNSVVFGNTDKLITNCNEIKTSFQSLNTIFEFFGKDGPLKEYYDFFNSICTIKEDANSKIIFSLKEHTKTYQKCAVIGESIFSFLQVLLGIITLFVITGFIMTGFNDTKNAWDLIIDYATIVEDLQGLRLTSQIINKGLNYSIYEDDIYDDSIFKTKLTNVSADADFLVDEVTNAIENSKYSYGNFKYATSLDDIFQYPINYTTTSGKSGNISMFASLMFKEIELRDITKNSTKVYYSKLWDTLSINNVCLRAIYKIAEATKTKLKEEILERSMVIDRVLTTFVVICILVAVINPIISMMNIQKFFTPLFCIGKLEIKKYSEKLITWIHDNNNMDSYTKEDYEKDDYKNIGYFNERIKAKEYKIGVKGLIARQAIVCLVTFIIILIALRSYAYIQKIQTLEIVNALSFSKYAFYLPSVILDLGYKFIELYTTQDYNATGPLFADCLRKVSRVFSEGTIEIAHFSHDIIDVGLYLADSDKNRKYKPSFSDIGQSFIIACLEYIEDEEYDQNHIKHTMKTCLEASSYYIPMLKKSLNQNLDDYFMFFTENLCFIVAIIVMVLLIVLIFNSSCKDIEPTPKDISWGAISTMPADVWDDFNKVIDMNMTNKDKGTIVKELFSLFEDNNILNRFISPIGIVDSNLNAKYFNQSALSVLKKSNIQYQNVKIQELCDACIKEFPKIKAIPYHADFVEGCRGTTRYNIDITEANNNYNVFTIRNVTDEFLIREQYINSCNKMNILLSSKLSRLDVKCNDIDIYKMETSLAQPNIISTWYIGHITTPECTNSIIKIIKDVISDDADIWFSGRSLITFKIYFSQKQNSKCDADFKAIRICSIIMKKLKKIQVDPFCYITKSEERRMSLIYGEYLLYETIDENSRNFLITLTCCENNEVSVSRAIYESLYNNNEIEFSYQATFGKETIYKVLTDIAKIDHTSGNNPSSEIITTMLSQMLKGKIMSGNYHPLQ